MFGADRVTKSGDGERQHRQRYSGSRKMSETYSTQVGHLEITLSSRKAQGLKDNLPASQTQARFGGLGGRAQACVIVVLGSKN